MNYQQRFIGQGTHGHKLRLREACRRHGAHVIVVNDDKPVFNVSATEALTTVGYVLNAMKSLASNPE